MNIAAARATSPRRFGQYPNEVCLSLAVFVPD